MMLSYMPALYDQRKRTYLWTYFFTEQKFQIPFFESY